MYSYFERTMWNKLNGIKKSTIKYPFSLIRKGKNGWNRNKEEKKEN